MISGAAASIWPTNDGAAFAALRSREFARLDRSNHVYLDYTGGGLYAESQIREHAELLAAGIYGNPHSFNPTSIAATELVERARAHVLEFFNASPDEYVVIFTQNATSALKLVGEAYPFAGGRLLMTYDNHNSVNGIRELARKRGAPFRYAPITAPELRIDEARLADELGRARVGRNNLFAFPAQSNFSGVQHPLEHIAMAQQYGWDVIADCATFAPTNRLDLSRWHPDFVPLSFYKMFGYPTGIGCLIARRATLAKLRRPWFSGGTVWGVSVADDFHFLLEGAPAFEDGTVNYLGIPAVEIGLRFLAQIGMDRIHDHVVALSRSLLHELAALHHDNGQKLVELFGPADHQMRGGTFALSFLDPDGRRIDERIIERTAHDAKISLRTGCFCNPGGFEGAWGLTREKFKVFRPTGWKLVKHLLGTQKLDTPTMQDYVDKLGLPTAGAVRISLGLASNAADIAAFVAYARSFLNTRPEMPDLRPRLGC
jgi:selenocysteine lyase/cysteine desulfurase